MRSTARSPRYEARRRAELERVFGKQAEASTALAGVIIRDPCQGCGVRADRHDEFGCRRWVG